ncbi:hypothetical protein BDW02DRAFT_568147 [Decorospora gaudefroyi]|uniref:Cryptic loci regulator 2 N-terminal domain-containing protein n=1 Tax=Decorospora gaudefroyi TaxID=184978 RepID=A0A6A5KNW1_9PLEO|nr:hypothetical protein BDW02DRAFT_568147 [Decorospora gaudefroyi]
MSSNRVVVPLRQGSDGDPTHLPKLGGNYGYTQINPPVLYLEKVGQQWMENRGDARAGVKYILEALPAGYTLWQRPRPTNVKHFDKYLYGHPSLKPFDSPNRFYPHFEYLMENRGSSIGCPCTVCVGGSGVLPSRMRSSSVASRPSKASKDFAPNPASTSQLKGRPKMISAGMDTTCVDQEGTPDVYRNLIDKLRRHERMDEIIQEPLSPDWRAEQEILPELLERLNTHEVEQWVPRQGDIVLFIRELPGSVWEAGLVTEIAKEAASLLINTAAVTNVTYSGLRVEPIPDPNSPDKSLSKRHKYVALRQTRPFFIWEELLCHIPQENWHPSIKNALTLVSTLSLMGKYRFRGEWPNASIYCHGIFIGSELLVVGDTVRLLPRTDSSSLQTTIDILSIKSIRLKWFGIDKASNNDNDEGRPYNSEIWIYGSAYTMDSSRSNKQWLSDANLDPPKGAADYAEWYPLHPADKELVVPYSRVFGRLYEKHAMAFFLNLDPEDVDLDVGRQGMFSAREYSRQHNQRISQEVGATWWWGDNRADALNLQTINSLDVSKYDPERDVKDMRKKIKLLDGIMKENQRLDAKSAATLAPNGRGLRHFMAPGTSTLPVRTTDLRAQSFTGSSEAMSSDGEGSTVSKKRPHDVILDGDENEDEIRQHTRLIDDDVPTPKTAKVNIVIS